MSLIHCTSCGTPLGFLSGGMSKKPIDFQFCNGTQTQGVFFSSYKLKMCECFGMGLGQIHKQNFKVKSTCINQKKGC